MLSYSQWKILLIELPNRKVRDPTFVEKVSFVIEQTNWQR